MHTYLGLFCVVYCSGKKKRHPREYHNTHPSNGRSVAMLLLVPLLLVPLDVK